MKISLAYHFSFALLVKCGPAAARKSEIAAGSSHDVSATLNANPQTTAFEGNARRQILTLFDCDSDPLCSTTNNTIKNTSASASVLGGDSYKGCWIDVNGNRAMEYFAGNGFSIENCIEECKSHGHDFAGLQYHHQCFCGSDYSKNGQAPEEECDHACNTGAGNCGGKWRLSIYQVEAPRADLPSTENEYLGCWKDQKGNRALEIFAGNNYGIESCIEECKTLDYEYAGLQYHQECFCGSDYKKIGVAYESECDHACNTGGGYCGGRWRLSIYKIGSAGPITPTLPTSTPTTKPKPTPAPSNKPTDASGSSNATEYKGCWADDNSNRAMEYSAGSAFGIDGCIEECRQQNYQFAGLQYHHECFCGNDYTKNGRAAESQCDHACRIGEGMCGGKWRLSIYMIGEEGQKTQVIPATPTPKPTEKPNQSPPANFKIDLDLVGVTDAAAFQSAAAKWSRVITGDTDDVSASLPGVSECGPWPTFIDDLYVCGRYKAIDGRGGVLGYAGPEFYRVGGTGTPITGSIVLDAEDAGQPWAPTLGVILHEMGHVLGIGTMWQINGLTSGYQVPCPYAINSKATQEYQLLSGCTGRPVPVEMSYQSGSNCGHWQEACFGSEIMTPSANSELPVSRLTIAALEDVGYQVNYNEAEPFNASKMSSSCLCSNNIRRRKLNEASSFLEDVAATPASLSSSSSSSRMLSEEGRAMATKYGKDILATREENSSNSLFPLPDNVGYIGSDIIYVMYEEHGTLHSVLVTLNS